MDCVFLNNILKQIRLRFPYFPVSNSKGKNSFHRHFNIKSWCKARSSVDVLECNLLLLNVLQPFVVVYVWVTGWMDGRMEGQTNGEVYWDDIG